MAEAEGWVERVALAALYLRGVSDAPPPPVRSLPAILHVIRVNGLTVEGLEPGVRRAGFYREAERFGLAGLTARAENLLANGSVLTAACPSYPPRLLGGIGWPALWLDGPMPWLPYVAVVGARRSDVADRRFARAVAWSSRELGYAVASGGAPGCDAAAAAGARSFGGEGLVEVLPFGLGTAPRGMGGARLSARAPDEGFSTLAAMERNALVYAMAEAAVIVRSRFRAGGTWHGAVDALRRKSTKLIVRDDPASPAHRALIGLGAMPLSNAGALGEAIAAAGSGGLFVDRVGESPALYCA